MLLDFEYSVASKLTNLLIDVSSTGREIKVYRGRTNK